MPKLEPLADIVVTSILMGRPMVEGANKLSFDQAAEVADLVADRLKAPWGGLAGYKIAWNSPSLMEKMEITHPGMGRVFQKFVRSDGAAIALSDFNELMFEVEIAAKLNQDIPPGPERTAEEIYQMIGSFSVSFELLNRYPGAQDANANAIIAHNVFNAGAVIGDIELPVDELSYERITTRLMQNGSVVFEDVNKTPQSPVEAVTFIANYYNARGYTLKADRFVLCGSHIPLFPVSEPGTFSVSMSNLGEVSFDVV